MSLNLGEQEYAYFSVLIDVLFLIYYTFVEIEGCECEKKNCFKQKRRL